MGCSAKPNLVLPRNTIQLARHRDRHARRRKDADTERTKGLAQSRSSRVCLEHGFKGMGSTNVRGALSDMKQPQWENIKLLPVEIAVMLETLCAETQRVQTTLGDETKGRFERDFARIFSTEELIDGAYKQTNIGPWKPL